MVNIKILQLNNKSRKGTYVYIKLPKVKGSYYKFDENVPIDAYVEYYKDRNNTRRKVKGTITEYKKAYAYHEPIKRKKGQRKSKVMRQADIYKKKISKRPTVNKAINKGIGQSDIFDAHNSQNQDIIKAKKSLLKNLVLDEDLLNLVISQENFKKIQARLEYRITFKDEQGGIIGTTSMFNKQPEKVLEKLKKVVSKGA